MKIVTPLRFLNMTGGTVPVSLFSDRLVLTERLVAILLTLLSVFLHAVFFVNAGGFWRDEANSISLALMPSLTDVWSALKYDSFPILYSLIVRFWANIFGSTDMSLRTLGFTIGIAITTALWLKSRDLGSRSPLLSLLLIGISPVMIRFLDSARPYGIAAIATILAFTSVWHIVYRPTFVRMIIASFMLVFCVQTLYQSAVFVIAIGIGALSVGLMRGGLKQFALLAAPFCISAVSLLPYTAHLQEAQEWSSVAANPSGTKLLSALFDAVRSPVQWFMWIWLAVMILAVLAAIQNFALTRFREDREIERKHFLLYCSIIFIASIACFLLFLIYMVGAISFQVWHFVPLLVLAVISAEPLVEHVMFERNCKGLYLLVITASAVFVLIPAAKNLMVRMTSVDLIASAIEREAEPNDLVILNPWYLGVSFNRYYQGNAPWATFPALPSTTIHRYDLLKGRMIKTETISEDIVKVSSTLQMGGRVWVVGETSVSRHEPSTSLLPSAPLQRTGWSSGPYLENWSHHLIGILSAHSLKTEVVTMYPDRMISPLESPEVAVFKGWIP